jgi:hypothetical protein
MGKYKVSLVHLLEPEIMIMVQKLKKWGHAREAQV